MTFVIRNYGNTRSLPYRDKHYFIARDGVIETSNHSLATALGKFPQISVIERPPARGEAPEMPEMSKLKSVIPEVRAGIDLSKLTRAQLFRLAGRHNIKRNLQMTSTNLIKRLRAIKEEL